MKCLAKKRLKEISSLLEKIIKKEEIPAWLIKKNKVFDGLTPLKMIELGEIRRIKNMIYELKSGNCG